MDGVRDLRREKFEWDQNHRPRRHDLGRRTAKKKQAYVGLRDFTES